MSRDYRFLRLSADLDEIEEMTLLCLNDADALLIAGRVGPAGQVEVWQGGRRVGTAAPGAGAAAESAEPSAAPDEPASDEPRVFNPFRRASWRRARSGGAN